MKTQLDCVPCFLDQALRAARVAGASEDVQREVLRRAAAQIATADWDATPIALGMPVHRIARELTGAADPYAEVKRESNQAALALYAGLRREVAAADDQIRLAAALAIAGNSIDHGAKTRFDLDATLDRAREVRFAVDDFDRLAQALASAESLIIFCDNAGEIVFDRLLMETILDRHPIRRVSAVVKSGPFINDATETDAREAGLTDIPNLQLLQVNNGDDDDAPAYESDEVRGWVRDHDVVISKGQANYEALSEYDGVFYLLMAKCECIANEVGAALGDIILQYR
mgnify:CR=1 FL=1